MFRVRGSSAVSSRGRTNREDESEKRCPWVVISSLCQYEFDFACHVSDCFNVRLKTRPALPPP
jgi:hypothetical protein